MLYKTHKKGGYNAFLFWYLLLGYFGLQQTGLLVAVFTDLRYALFGTFTAFCLFAGTTVGAKYPDYDHATLVRSRHSSLSSKFVFFIVVKVLRQHHRSKFTHSLDGIIIATAIRFYTIHLIQLFLIKNYVPFVISEEILTIFITINLVLQAVKVYNSLGFLVGALNHWALDTLTPGGAYISMFLEFKVMIVPANVSILGWKPFHGKFATGSNWEKHVRTVLHDMNGLLQIIAAISLVIKFSDFNGFSLMTDLPILEKIINAVEVF